MQLVAWIFFFVVYGLVAAYVMLALSARRIRDPGQSSKPQHWFLALGGMTGLAIVPPLAELCVRVYVDDAMTKQDLGLGAFIVLWVSAFLPGAIKSRRMLRAAGIDSDANG
ncbi:hypothetical protein ASE26_22850 [Duganella sp. Root198D2]|nr:hypothetical protein ASE26_22850 [Duganella sp. Root198D2]